MVRLRPLVKGLLTFVPGVRHLLLRKGTGGTTTARYCYEVWLKHVTLLWAHGMRSIPGTIAELGPGDSWGVGLAAMLSGVDHLYVVDVVPYANTTRNLRILDELVAFLENRSPRRRLGWPDYDAHLDENLFPSAILTEQQLARSLTAQRVQSIRSAVQNPNTMQGGVSVRQVVPWTDENALEANSVDLILSHSVLEHVDDLRATYRAMHRWLKPGGRMSHQIDLTAHGVSNEWNGFRAYPEPLWKLIVGRRPFLINRQPCSVHLDLIARSTYETLCVLKRFEDGGIDRSKLSSYWQHISDDDLNCGGLYLQARKTAASAVQPRRATHVE